MTTAIKDVAPQYDVEYNDFAFGPLCQYRLTGQPVYDPARRTVIYVEYTLDVTSIQYAASESALATIQLNLREKLSEARGKLRIAGVGWGETDTHSTYEPISWGPMPGPTTFRPLGGGICWELTWSCKFGINECASRNLKNPGGSPFVLFNYDVTYTHDELGFTTRTVSGVLQIPQHGRTRTVNDIPENYRDKINIPIPRGFEQVGVTTRANSAQNELHFTVVQKQLDHEPYPPGLARCDVTFSVNGRHGGDKGGGILDVWFLTAQGEMETVPGFPKGLAYMRFLQIAYSRWLAVKSAIGYGPTVLIAAFDAAHKPWSRSSSFRMSWLIKGAQDGQLLRPGVLYSPIPQEQRDYDSWLNEPFNGASLQRLWTAGGQTNLSTLSPDIVDLCAPTYNATLLSTGGTYPLGADGSFTLPSEFFNCQQIEPRNSWIAYEPVAQLYRTERLNVNKRDLVTTFDFNYKYGGTSPKPSFSMSNSDVNGPYDAAPDSLSQAGLPEQLLVFKGKAIRVHFPVSVPRITSIEGVSLTLLKNVQESTPYTQLYGGCKLYTGRWIQVYRPDAYLAGRVLSMPHPHVTTSEENAA